MTTISATMVKQLREKTGAGMMDCKQALTECDADIDKAVDFLRKKGLATARKRAGRTMTEGTIQSYIHMGGKLGVLVEVNCETDFVAKNEDFINFAKNIAMHIAATSPLSIQAEDVAEEIINREKEIYKSQALYWIKEDDSESFTSFINICNYLDIDVDNIRKTVSLEISRMEYGLPYRIKFKQGSH